MPIAASVSPLRAPLRVAPRPSGGFARVSAPDPNDAMPTRLRQSPPLAPGVNSMRAMPDGAALQATFVAPTGESALARNLALQTRAAAETQAADASERARNMFAPPRTVLRDPRWSALFQALFESGAGHTRAENGALPTSGGLPDVTSAAYGFTPEQQATMIALRRQNGDR
jgi:hypothetical protein